MKFNQETSEGSNRFTGYGDGYFLINEERHEGSLIVTAETVAAWPVTDFAELAAEHFAMLLDYAPEVVLFGTGKTIRFPHPRLTAALTNAHIGVEVMDSQAACRTFNILMGEDRKVLAVLLG
ncbi:Mth938-like domain-containing protein [Neisseriaceae bacterium JH1-16]|nr:Mth938-like domain-containing protein [Neisseriaceae bacterium JH1-16]